MKRSFLISILFASMLLVTVPANNVHAQDPFGLAQIIKAGVKKVIQAMDLRLQRLQNRLMVLQNAQKALENSMAKLKLTEISEWGQKQKDLYGKYYDELKTVRNSIALYKRVKDVATYQVNILAEYKRAWSLISRDKHFNANELAYMQSVYTGIIDESVKNLEQLRVVSSSFQTQMSDGKRLELIDAAADKMEVNFSDLREFTDRNMVLSIQRSRTVDETETMKAYYGIQ
jgi:hypothetical protein